MGANRFRVRRPEVHRDGLDRGRPALGQGGGEEPIEGGRGLARGTPDDGAGVVVRDQRQVLVVLAPGDLIDADIDQPAKSVGVQFLGHDAGTHAPGRCAT